MVTKQGRVGASGFDRESRVEAREQVDCKLQRCLALKGLRSSVVKSDRNGNGFQVALENLELEIREDAGDSERGLVKKRCQSHVCYSSLSSVARSSQVSGFQPLFASRYAATFSIVKSCFAKSGTTIERPPTVVMMAFASSASE